MGKPGKPKLRWYQLRLRSIAMGVTLIAIGLASWAAFVRPYLEQSAIRAAIRRAGGTFESEGGPALLQELLGEDTCQNLTLVNLADIDPKPGLLVGVSSLPRLEVLVLGGVSITDESLRNIPACESLQAVILDSTLVSEAALESVRAARPDVYFARCDRRSAQNWTHVGTEQTSPPAFLAKRLPAEYFRVAVAFTDGIPFRDAGESREQAVMTMHHLRHVRLVQSDSHSDDMIAILATRQDLRVLELHFTSQDRFQAPPGNPPYPLDLYRRPPPRAVTQLAKLKQLKTLTLTGAPVDDTFVQQLADMGNLSRLDLSHTAVQDPASWPALPLKYLNLEGTFIEDDDLQPIARYTELEELLLNFTELSDAGLVDLLPLRKLRRLDLRRTRITESSYEVLCQLPLLEEFSIGSFPRNLARPRFVPFRAFEYTPLPMRGTVDLKPFDREAPAVSPAFREEIREEFRREIRQAQQIVPGVIDVKHAPDGASLNLDLLEGVSEIISLQLGEGLVQDADLAYIASMPDLRYLDLSESWVTDAGLNALAGCPQLKHLNLAGTMVTDAGMAHLAQIQSLEQLTLPAQTVRGPGLEHLLALPRLHRVTFEKPKIRPGRNRAAPDLSADDIKSFRALAAHVLAAFDSNQDGILRVEEATEHMRDRWLEERETHGDYLSLAPCQDIDANGVLSVEEVLQQMLAKVRVSPDAAPADSQQQR